MDTFRKHLANVPTSSISRNPKNRGRRIYKSGNELYLAAFMAWRYQFCREFAACMPAELREIMYDHLLEPEYIVTYVEGHECEGIKALCDPRKVGQQLADEISYFLLSRQTLDILDLSHLSSALQSQMLPRGVRVHFWGQDSNTIYSGLKATPDVLKLLLSKQVRAGTAIEFVVHFLPTEDCTDFLRIIAPGVFKLKEKGVDVTIIRSYKSIYNCPTRYLAGKFFLDWDLSWLFAGDVDYFTRNIVNNKKRKHKCISKLGVKLGKVVRFEKSVRPRTTAPPVPK